MAAVCVALCPPESNVVTLMWFDPETSGIAPVAHEAEEVPLDFATAVPL